MFFHVGEGVFFKAAHLRLGNADLTGHFHLGTALEDAHRKDMFFAL